MFVDTHCHLDMMVLKEEHQELTEVHFVELDRIMGMVRNAGIIRVINVGTNIVGTKNSLALARCYADVFATVGIHPCDCDEHWRDDIKELEKLLPQKNENKIVAIGETGLDFYHQPFDKERQVAVFKRHIELALTYDLPVVVHSRDSSQEVLAVLQEYKADGLRGVLHCYSHPAYVAEQVLAWGFYIGMGAYVTYPKNNELREFVKNMPLERLLLETDAPFLPPQQYRGKQNTPAYIPLFAHMIADLRNVEHQELGRVTTENAQRLFGFNNAINL